MKLAVIGRISTTKQIPNADLIHQAVVDCGDAGRWSGVVSRDMQADQLVVVLLQDALLPESERWPWMAKHKWRVRMARFRGVPSECLIVPLQAGEPTEVGTDVTQALGVTKYEKPIPAAMAGVAKKSFPSFIPKTDEENFQRVDHEQLMDDVSWYATLKYDGTSCTVWVDDDGMHVCSRNLELEEFSPTGATNVYWEAARKYRLDRLPPGRALQFEICGPGIQGNPFGADEIQIAAFTIYWYERHERGTLAELASHCQLLNIPMARIVATGFGAIDAEAIRTIAEGIEYRPGVPAEGVVFRDLENSWSFKAINLLYKERP